MTDIYILHGEIMYDFVLANRNALAVVVLFAIIFLSVKVNDYFIRRKSNCNTILWMNGTYAVYTSISAYDYHYIGGSPKSVFNKLPRKMMLKSSWGIENWADAEKAINELLNFGHNHLFMAEPELSKTEFYKPLTDEGIKAWDYSRAMSLLGTSYVVGYISFQDSLNRQLSIAKAIQSMFSSWDEFYMSYCKGYFYWSGNSPIERMRTYEKIKTEPKNPFDIDWNLDLCKEW